MNNSIDGISLDQFTTLLGVLEEAKITTIFNMKPSERTGFINLTANTIKQYKKELVEDTNINSHYAVFAYPNFTILDGKTISNDKNDPNSGKLKIPGVYIAASYVAAGIIVASQQPRYLEKCGFKVNKSNVCTRINLEDEKIQAALMTKMNRETSFNWPQSIVEEIRENDFGFIFSSNDVFKNNIHLKNTYVYNARNMYKENDNYEPIYCCMMNNFLETYMAALEINTDEKISAFRKTIRRWKQEAEATNTKDDINLIFKLDDTMNYEEENQEFDLDLKGAPKIVKVKIKNKNK